MWARIQRWWHAKKASTKALWSFVGCTTAFLLQILALLGVLLLVLHGANLYPQVKAEQQNIQLSGEHTWSEVCHKGFGAFAAHTSHVNCERAFQDSRIYPSVVALEKVMHHLLSDLNIFRYLVPSSHSSIGFFVLRTVDGVLSYFVILIGVSLAACAWYLWTFRVGPYNHYQQLMTTRQWDRPFKLSDYEAEDSGLGSIPIRVNENLLKREKRV
jgi:hypothetical protein